MEEQVESSDGSFVVQLTLWLAKFVGLVEYQLQVPFYHLLLEFALTVWIISLLTRKSYSPKEPKLELSREEEDKLIDEWQPDPLIPTNSKPHAEPQLLEGKAGHRMNINGKDCLNMGTMNFLGFIGNQEIEDRATATLRKYGVGTCGPRGFYGTIDVHLDLEKKIADFIGTEEAILYSYGFSTIASAIPAYSKRTDVIFCDDGVTLPVLKGIEASRSKVYWFKHNDMRDLEDKLLEQHEKDLKIPKKAQVTRRFLVVEGLYTNYGDIAPLPELIALKNKYKVRILIDETASFSVLGKTGRGITEHFGVPFTDVDMIAVSLETSLASVGGFCAGSRFVIDHQRLAGQGYCFSASLPPFLAVAAHTAIEILEKDPSLFSTLQQICTSVHEKLSSITGCLIDSDPISPIKHLRLDSRVFPLFSTRQEEEDALASLVEYCIDKSLAITVARYLDQHKLPKPSIRITCNVHLSSEDIEFATGTIQSGITTLLAASDSTQTATDALPQQVLEHAIAEHSPDIEE